MRFVLAVPVRPEGAWLGVACLDPPGLMRLSVQAELRTGKRSRATKRLESLSARFPQSAAVAFVHASACLDVGAPQRALQIVQDFSAASEGGTDAGEHGALQTCQARAHAALGQLERALGAVQAAVDIENRVVHAHMHTYEFHPWRVPEETRPALKQPHLVVHTWMRAARRDYVWLREEVTRAQLDIARALIPMNAQRAFTLAGEAVSSGKVQLESHSVAAEAALAHDARAARPHLMAALRLAGNDPGVLRLFCSWATSCGQAEDAAAVELLADELQRLGKGRVPASVQAAAHDALDRFMAGE